MNTAYKMVLRIRNVKLLTKLLNESNSLVFRGWDHSGYSDQVPWITTPCEERNRIEKQLKQLIIWNLTVVLVAQASPNQGISFPIAFAMQDFCLESSINKYKHNWKNYTIFQPGTINVKLQGHLQWNHTLCLVITCDAIPIAWTYIIFLPVEEYFIWIP